MASNVSIVIATKGAKDAANDIHEIGVKAEESGGHLGKLGSALGSIGTIAGGIIAAKGIETLGGAIRGAFSDAQEYQKMQAATNAVIESTGGKAGMSAKAVVDLANSLESVTAVDDQVIQGAENLLLTFTSIGKDVFPQATETVLNMSTALGQDAKSSAIQLGKALNDPINGVTALRRVGVSFTEAQLAQIAAMQKSGDLMGAQKIILSELNTEFGGAAKAAGSTFAGQLSLLQDTISDTFRDIAVKALPTLLQLTTIMAGLLPKAIDITFTAIGLLRDGVVFVGEKVGNLLAPAFDILASAVERVSGPLVDFYGTITGLVASDFLSGNFLDGIRDIGFAIGELAFELGVPAPIAEALSDAFDHLANGIETAIPIIKDFLGLAWDKLKELASLSWDKLQGGIDSLKALAEAKFDQVAPQFQSIATSLKGIDLQTFADGWNRVKEAIQPAVDALKPLVEQLLKALKDQFQQVGEALKPLGGALKDLAAAFAPLEPLLKPLGIVLGTVIVAAIGLLLVSLRLFTEFLTITLVGAIKVATLAIEGIAAVFEKVLTLLAPYVAKFISIGTDIIEGLFEGVKKGAEPLWNWLKDVGPAILRFVGDLGRILFDAGKAVIQGLWDGIESMLGWFGDKLGSIGGFISAHKGPIEADALLLVPHGKAIMAGLADGIAQGYEQVVQPLVSSIAGAIQGAALGGPAIGIGPVQRGVVRASNFADAAALQSALSRAGVGDWAADASRGYQGAATSMPPIHVTLNIDGQAVASVVARAANLAMS